MALDSLCARARRCGAGTRESGGMAHGWAHGRADGRTARSAGVRGRRGARPRGRAQGTTSLASMTALCGTCDTRRRRRKGARCDDERAARRRPALKKVGARRVASVTKSPKAESRKPKAESRKPKAESRMPGTRTGDRASDSRATSHYTTAAVRRSSGEESIQEGQAVQRGELHLRRLASFRPRRNLLRSCFEGERSSLDPA